MKHNPNRFASLGEPLLNGLLWLLLLVLFVQCGVFMGMYASMRRSSAEMPFDMRMLSASSSELYRALNPELLAPEFIAVQEDAECYAVFHSQAVVEELYAEMSGCLFAALSGKPEAVSAAEWQRAMEGTFGYARYKEELPYQVVCAFAGAYENSDVCVRQAEEYTGVREVLLSAGQDGDLSALLVRGALGVYRFPLATI